MRESSCYFSYSWDDTDPKILEEIKARIKERSYGKVEVYYDIESNRYADSISQKMSKLSSSDTVVVFFTPSYKKKALNDDDQYGVTKEYKLIKEKQKTNSNCIIPILAKGNNKKSITSEFKDIWYCDISEFTYKQNAKRRGRIVFSEKKFEDIINNLVSIIIQKSDDEARLKNIDFNDLNEEYKILFFDLADNKKLPAECLIKVEAYEAILNQSAYFVVGRKGSGKSTLLNVIENYDRELFQKNYKLLSPILADSINLDYVYKIIFENNKEDLKELPLQNLLRVFWELFLSLQSIYIVCLEEESEHILDERRNVIKRMSSILRKKMKIMGSLDQENVRRNIFTLSAELFNNFIKNGIFNNKLMDEETTITSVNNNLTAIKILESCFGVKLFEKYCYAINDCKKKILIALDGFDIDSEEFRRNTANLKLQGNEEEYIIRSRFEAYFYRDLLVTVDDIRKLKFGNCMDKLFSKIDFCIILPQDRFDQIRQFDRDIIKKQFCYLNWDAQDLLEMLVLRLERYYKIQPNKSNNLKTRYENVIKQHLPRIPITISINVNGHAHQFNLFNYLLRLSFWRPRDVQRNFAILMKLHKSYNENETMSESLIKQFLAHSAKKIIMEEFIKEYENVYYNLENVLHCFDSKEIIMPLDDFNTILSKIKIESTNSEDINENVKRKFELLYKLGIVGIYFDKSIVEKKGYGHHICFVFNEGLTPFKNAIDICNPDKTKLNVIFNPIFSKFLSLNWHTDELIGDFDWDYIANNHLRKDMIARL